MAINDDKRDDGLERDPKLARLYRAASGEEPPAALDAAILAAARREAGARPQVVGGSGEAGVPPVRAMHVKRNWYVPVSIAAVMVLSVSLVTLVHQEKGDELAQPPMTAGTPSKSSAPAAAPAAETPAVAAAPAASAKADAMLDAAPAKRKLAEEDRIEAKKESTAAAAPEGYADLARKQRTEKVEPAAEAAVAPGPLRKDQPASAVTREQGPPPAPVREAEVSGRIAQERQRSGIGVRGFDSASVGAAASQAPSARDAKAAPEPFPVQAPASRDAAEARPRSEADDRNATRGAMQEAPVASAAPVAPPPAAAAPPVKAAAAPHRAAPVEDGVAPSSPSLLEGRASASPPPSPMAKPAAKPAPRLLAKPAPLWRGLEDQPPEKWLERLAEFKRDNRQADADELLVEFRRRFPEHPASAR